MIDKLRVEASSRHYAVTIGDDEVFDVELARFFRKVSPRRKVMVVTDSNVGPLWWPTMSKIIEKNAGCKTWCHIIRAGEESKCIDEWKKILSELAGAQFTRDDLVVALGGGVVGDLAGFVASTYMRGIDWIQAPTSLLAMVDASVGGKTAIDLDHFKNIIGSFWQPLEVFANVKVLDTLPSKWINDGLGEVLKCSLLGAGFDLSELLSIDRVEALRPIIKKCVALKAMVVKNDENDKNGIRACLNLGHTLGHGLEKESGFEISHGVAVMLGVVAACKLAMLNEELMPAELDTIKSVVSSILGEDQLEHLKNTIGQMSSSRLAEVMMHDKKSVAGGLVEVVLPISMASESSGIPVKMISISNSELEEKFVKPALEEIASI